MNRKNWIAFVPYYLLVVILFIGIAGVGDAAVSVVNQSNPVIRAHRIVIDPGHGGEDGGATSCTGVLESHMNLQIAMRLRDLLHLLGYETVMIRTEDISVYTEGETLSQKKISDLKNRVRSVNDTQGAILVSIHQNTFSDSRYGGAQVFYAHTQGSRELAISLQQRLVEALNPGSQRKAKKGSGVYLMEHIEKTGILVECGFLTNPQEEAMLRTDSYQQRLCCVIASVLSDHINA